jgi:TolB-like protein/Tfp pilus assembly protein PilF/predicted Ser/Thr protein kinase
VVDLRPGSRLGPYEILGTLGQGGMGQVYRARDTRLQRDVAIKILSPALLSDESARARFHKEALALAKLKHRNVAHIYDVMAAEGADALVMELVEGPSLGERLREGPLPEDEVLRIGAQLADGLSAAHAEGVVHCDLKPANLKLTRSGDLKILDFGVAKLRLAPAGETSALDTFTSTQREVAGTLPYMAPEQLRAEHVDGRTDIWAAGVVLCEMATGSRPFKESIPARLTDAILHADPEFSGAATASEGLREIVKTCLRKDPALRYATAAELKAGLEGLRTAPLPVAPAGAAPARPRGFPPRASLGLGALALLALLFVADVGRLRSRWSKGSGRIDSLAVLPFANLSRDPEQEYFADGMTEAVITELSRIRALKVISRTSVMPYKNATKSLPEIARALGVKGVVEGSVLRDGGNVRITIQLIEADSDRHLWAESYTRDARNVLALQSEVAMAIAREVRVAVSPEEAGRLGAGRPVDPEAHRLVLLGTYAIAQSLTQRQGIEKSVALFRKAVEADPGFALARARLAEALQWGGFAGYRPMTESCAEARAEAQRSLELDPRRGETLSLLAGLRRSCDFDWAGAERDVRRALELSPGSAAVHNEASYLMSVLSRHEDAIREGRTAEQLDPLSEQVSVSCGMRLAFARRFGEAVQQFQKALVVHPESVFAKWALANTLTSLERYDEAIALFLSRKVPDPGSNFSLGLTYGLAGRKEEAKKVLATLLERRKTQFLPPTQIALVYAGLGERDTAFAWLESAYEDKAWLVDLMNVEPLFDVFRKDPRFFDLLRRMNYPLEPQGTKAARP